MALPLIPLAIAAVAVIAIFSGRDELDPEPGEAPLPQGGKGGGPIPQGGHGGAPPKNNAPGPPSIVVPGDSPTRARLRALGELSTPKRDEAIFDMIIAGDYEQPRWTAVDVDEGGNRGRVFVTEDSLKVGVPGDYIRVAVRAPTAQKIADFLGVMLPTSKIVDQAWLTARDRGVVLKPKFQTPDSHMGDTSRFIKHNDRVEAELAGRGGLVRTVGKEWIIANELSGNEAIQFGWHDEKNGQFTSQGGLRIWQPADLDPSTPPPHGTSFVDYETATTFVRADAELNSASVPTATLLAGPFADLFSYEGPMTVLRYETPFFS